MTRHLLFVLVLLVSRHVVLAHSFEPALLDLRERNAGMFDVGWKLPGPESGSLLAGEPAPEPQLPEHCHSAGPPATDNPDIGAARYWRVDCGPAGLRGARLAVGGLAGSRLDVILRITWEDGTSVSSTLRSGAEEFVVPLAPVSHGIGPGAAARAVLLSYGRLGVAHILGGVDHLLFVFGLLLLVPSWRLLVQTITAFTLAHSLALALAVLGVVTVPASPVEVMIALSIVLVALETTRPSGRPATLTQRYPWLIALGFGLIHGLGFAGALADIGVPRDQVALALMAFNVGVELGQLAFVAVMLAPLALFTRVTRSWPRLRLVPAYTIGTLAVAWTLDRAARFWAS